MTSSNHSIIRSFDHSIISKVHQGFTLIELLVVIAMIVIIMASMTTAVASARERARIQKATSDVKVISQAILAYENYVRGGQYDLPERSDVDASGSESSLGFLIGKGGAAKSGGEIPVLLQAALDSGGTMRDPWGTPYKVKIKAGNANLKLKTVTGSLKTGYYLPNLYRNGGRQ